METSLVYLDNNATTKIAPEVLTAMFPVLERVYGNPSSRHKMGLEAAKSMQKAREQVSRMLGCHPQEIVFTGCGTESDNLAICGAAEMLPETKRHIITTQVEHPAVKNAVAYLSKKGFQISRLKVDREGMLDLQDLRAVLSDNTGLVSVMYANNETGVVFPIEKIARIIKEKGALFHVDAVQAASKIPIDLSACPIDLLSISGHKFHAPKGVGALFVRENTQLHPQILGGSQEGGLRGGTEAIPNIVAMGIAAELAIKNLPEYDKVGAKRDRLENWILQNIPGTQLYGDKVSRLPNTSNIGFSGLEGETILLSLSKEGICVSTGAACSSGSVKPSETLTAMKVPRKFLFGSIRFSLSCYTTDDEIDYTIECLAATVKKLRAISEITGKL